ncbi:MAG: lytic transglycosylase [Spirochaetales bacterium]|nr:MAG: lytic transglycosylase [Spirochaetales bacterium]
MGITPADTFSENGVQHIAVHVSEMEDIGLALYRNQLTRQVVQRFYAQLTGNKKISDVILLYADQYQVPVSLAFSLAWAESRYYPLAVNRNYSSVDRGLFQLNSLSFPQLGEQDFFNPSINAKNGLRYLQFCLKTGGNHVVALAMYNAGSNRVEAGGTPRGTLDYIAQVLDYRDIVDHDFSVFISEHNVGLIRI